VGATFEKALERNVLPRRLGDVCLGYETTMLVGRADKPARGLYAVLCLVAGVTFGLATLAAFLSREDDMTLALLVAPSVVAFASAAWLEQRDRRQRVFVVDFDQLILRLDFSTPLVGMPRTLRVPFESVRDVELSEMGRTRFVLTVDFEKAAGLYREVLIANLIAAEHADAERVRRLVRAAVGLEKPAEPDASSDAPVVPPVTDSFG
jgi:hypothetical protein